MVNNLLGIYGTTWRERTKPEITIMFVYTLTFLIIVKVFWIFFIAHPRRKPIAESLLQWNSVEFETEAAKRKMVATAMRSFREWDEHPQGKALAGVPPVSLRKIGDAPKRPITDGQRPLEGFRVLDLTRVLAGPICGRTLAAHGADVLLITSPKLPTLPFLDTDTSRGKRTTQLDLTEKRDRDVLSSLVKDADVLLQAYRPGGMAAKGFGVEEVIRAKPGVVYANLNAYGWDGPWSDRRGFDSLVQTATGFNIAEAEAFAAYKGDSPDGTLSPKPLPMQALDHAAGYLLATGIQAALARTITEGGSWEVRVSLASVGQWVRSLGQLEPATAFGAGSPLPPVTLPPHPEISRILAQYEQTGERMGAMGEAKKVISAVRHAAVLERTPVREGGAPVVLNADNPTWLPRQ
ncbi:hypothetical protein QCA50_006499 [Cerrena zonata]|uniref:Uncharacterized protein n=1 Tax=Cerrena zonata TaxID=2478898 RepID=A0AAW0GLA0_9APHY